MWHDGITPAWAGKSTAAKCCANGIRDHPRVGGEKIPAGAPLYAPCGSPPRGRGKARSIMRSPTMLRITPAWAGKRRPRWECLRRCRDHPRVGGEKGYKTALRGSRKGSPPRGRGKGKA